MNKQLLSKALFALMLISTSAQIFGMGLEDVRKFFHIQPVKSVVVNAATLVPATTIPIGLAIFHSAAHGRNFGFSIDDCLTAGGIALTSKWIAEKHPAGYVAGATMTIAAAITALIAYNTFKK